MELHLALFDMWLLWSREETRVQFLDEQYSVQNSKPWIVRRPDDAAGKDT